MAKIVSVHSFRGGTGKSNTTANVAATLATRGLRVGVIDTDIQSPGIHVLFGLGEDSIRHSLNDYLWGKCRIQDTAHDVTPPGIPGKVFLIPSSTRTVEITRILRDGYDVGLLNEGLQGLSSELELDALFIDTHPGLNEETLLSIAISDALLIIMRPDHQDYQGTSVTVEVARSLEVPRMMLVVNKTPASFDREALKTRVAQTYGCPVAVVVPHSDDLMVLASEGVFSLRYPDHEVTALYQSLASQVLG